MKILLIDNETTLLEKLKILIPSSEVVVCWNNIDMSTLDDYDLIVLSGSSTISAFYHQDKLKNEIEIIKNTHKPIIGICFGCELIAQTFGSTLKRLDERKVGITQIQTETPNHIFEKPSYTIFENHRWIIEDVSNELEVLARSDHAIAALKHKDKPIYGFQFHPENKPDKTDGDELFLKLFSSFT